MSIAKVTATEVFESLTGHDEVAVTEAFGASSERLQGTMLARSLVFVLERRDGKPHNEAYEAAMAIPQKALLDYFVPEDDDEAGKDETSVTADPADSVSTSPSAS
jgi:hypothetical protein